MLPTGDASGSFRPVPPFAYAASTAPISPRPQSLKGIRKDGGVGAASALKCLVHEGQFVAGLTYRAGRYVYVEQGSFLLVWWIMRATLVWMLPHGRHHHGEERATRETVVPLSSVAAGWEEPSCKRRPLPENWEHEREGATQWGYCAWFNLQVLKFRVGLGDPANIEQGCHAMATNCVHHHIPSRLYPELKILATLALLHFFHFPSPSHHYA